MDKVTKNFVVENLADEKAKVKAIDVVVTEHRPIEWCKRSVIMDYNWSDSYIKELYYLFAHNSDDAVIRTTIKRSGSSKNIVRDNLKIHQPILSEK